MRKSTVHALSCPAAVAAGKVCAHAVTVDDLHSWGIDVRHTIADHIVEGTVDSAAALHAAWLAGHVRMCTLDPASTGRPWLCPKVQSAESIADALALPAHRSERRHVVLVEFVRGDGDFRDSTRDRRFDFSEVEVLATSESEAHLLASQMVACRPGVQVTRTLPSC